jgi:hypothetical protein
MSVIKLNKIEAKSLYWGCETSRIPHCLDKWLTDGGEVVSLTQRPRSDLQKYVFSSFWCSFLLESEQTPGP